jgi:tetratricopeptide (TPR) repeat protein
VPLAIGPWPRSRTERGELARADQENLHRALDWATATESTDALRIITILSTLHPEIRPPDHLGERIRAALDATPDAPPALRAIALARLAWDVIETFGDESLAPATELSEQALALARGTDDPRTLAEVAMWSGFVQDSTAIGLEGVAAADATGDPTFATYLRLEAVRFCDYETCATLLRDAQRLVELHHIDEYRATIAVSIAETAARRGDATAALAAVDRALEADAAAPFNHRLETRVHGAIILADEGRFDDAEALLADGLSLLSSTQTDLSMEREARGARAHLARVRGDLKAARLAASAALGADRPYLFRTDGLALLALSAADRDDGRIAEAVGSLVPVIEWLGPRGADTRAQAMEELAACLVDIDGTEEAARVLVTADRLRRAEWVPLAPARVPTVEALRVEIGPTELATAEPMPDGELLDLARALAQPGE